MKNNMIIGRFKSRVSNICHTSGLLIVFVLAVLQGSILLASTYEWWQVMRNIEQKKYICYRAEEALVIDGKLDEASWKQVPWTSYFEDLGSETIESYQKQTGPPQLKTRVKMLWDDYYFYIGADLEEPHVWGTFLWHDQIICLENNFEIFIDATADHHNYVEIEINALNTVWDLVLNKPYRDKCNPDQAWNIYGLQKDVFVDGTLNNPKDIDKGWSIEFAIPWKALAEYSGYQGPPPDQTQWRINFARTEFEHEVITSDHTTSDVKNNAYKKKEDGKVDIWSWRSHGIRGLHAPEMFGIVQFTRSQPGKAKWIEDLAEEARLVLLDVYYAQSDYFKIHGKYASDIKNLGLINLKAKKRKWKLAMKLTDSGYLAWVLVKKDNLTKKLTVRQDSKLEYARTE
jgi:hypothetical protein